jgi:heme exporter protein C
MWGAYWVWDARLTSVLILFFLYLGLMALRSSLDDEALAGKLTAILALVGVVILPVIKFSVDWWNTLHQPSSIFRSGGPSIDASMLVPFFIMMVAYALYFGWIFLLRLKAEVLARRVQTRRLRMMEA